MKITEERYDLFIAETSRLINELHNQCVRLHCEASSGEQEHPDFIDAIKDVSDEIDGLELVMGFLNMEYEKTIR